MSNAELLKRIEALEDDVRFLRARLASVEARPVAMPSLPYTRPPQTTWNTPYSVTGGIYTSVPASMQAY